MNEIVRNGRPPYADYPFMFGGTELPTEFKDTHTQNRQFAKRIVLPEDPGYQPTAEDLLTIETGATVLTSIDHRLGRNTAGLGTMRGPDMEGLWDTLPTFYHNGDGTRLAVLNTKIYMDYVNRLEGGRSPYANREVYRSTLLAAHYDDLVFGPMGRGGDEEQSRILARTHLFLQGFRLSTVHPVDISIDSSTYDEVAYRQRYTPSRGAKYEQIGSLVGDNLHSATAVGTMTTIPLFVENTWKRDTSAKHGQILMHTARGAASYGWRGNSLEDFLALAQTNPEAVRQIGDELINNREYLLKDRPFVDSRISALARPGLEENALLQRRTGIAVNNGDLPLLDAFHLAVSYAEADKWLKGERKTAALGLLTPDMISAILLAPRPIEAIQRPISADHFFKAYMAERREFFAAEPL